jgi:hypothetical protein
MNSDDIYKFIGYAVAIIFGFYIVSKSLNFQIKAIEHFTCKTYDDDDDDDLTNDERRERDKEKTEAERERKRNENEIAETVYKTIIRKINIKNNKLLNRDFSPIGQNVGLIEEYNKLIDIYIQREKINICNIIYNKGINISFSNIINDLKIKCEKIKSLSKSINYIAAVTSGNDLVEEIEYDTDEEPEEETEDKESAQDRTERKEAEEKLKDELIETNDSELKYNSQDIECIQKTQPELQTKYTELLTSFINEEKIYIVDLLLSIGEDLTTYDSNIKQIENHNINISVLQQTESILMEVFSGGVSGGSSIKGKGKRKRKSKGKKGFF